MPNIKPVSDLRNYNNVLKACQIQSPVFLTKKGKGKYVLLDIEDFEKMKASLKLMAHLEEGEKAAREEGWISSEEMEEILGL